VFIVKMCLLLALCHTQRITCIKKAAAPNIRQELNKYIYKKKQAQRGNERRGQPFLTAGDGEPYGSRVGDGAGGPRRRGRESPPPPPATEAEEARGS